MHAHAIRARLSRDAQITTSPTVPARPARRLPTALRSLPRTVRARRVPLDTPSMARVPPARNARKQGARRTQRIRAHARPAQPSPTAKLSLSLIVRAHCAITDS